MLTVLRNGNKRKRAVAGDQRGRTHRRARPDERLPANRPRKTEFTEKIQIHRL